MLRHPLEERAMGKLLTFMIVRLIVAMSLVAAPAAMGAPALATDTVAAAHHHDADSGRGVHDECATIGCCVWPTPNVRPLTFERAGDPIALPLVAILVGERPQIPPPPPKPPV